MDSLTAGIGLLATQLCVTLALLGIYVAAPHERATRYWVAGEILLATGMLVIVFNGGGSRLPLIFIGNAVTIYGGILQYWGVQRFFGEPRGRAGWLLGGIYTVGLIALMAAGGDVHARVVLFSCTMLCLMLFAHVALRRGMAGQHSFGALLVHGALFALALNNSTRIALALFDLRDLAPGTRSPVGVTLLYIVPQLGILAYATGLVLLCFERIVREKHHLATHDELTGLLNRRAIVAGGEREVELALRAGQPLTVAIADIDFFKRVNDQLGHESGDVVLTDMARLLVLACRRVDLVGRYGGEEFCIVLPGMGEADAATVGERLVAAARAYRFRDAFPVTISIGLATMPAGSAMHSWSGLVSRADAALYEAKRRGRDRYCTAAGEGALPVAPGALWPEVADTAP